MSQLENWRTQKVERATKHIDELESIHAQNAVLIAALDKTVFALRATKSGIAQGYKITSFVLIDDAIDAALAATKRAT